MHILLGALLGAAAATALQAVAVAYLVALLAGAALLGAIPVLIGTLSVPSARLGHWMGRPAAQAIVLALGTIGALALTIRLLGGSGGEEVHLVRPLVPGLLASIVDLGLLVALAVRGARRARAAVRGSDVETGARSIGGLAVRAVCRAVAVVVLGAAVLALLGSVALASDASAPTDANIGIVVIGAATSFLIGGLGSLLAWWGRRGPSAAAPS